MRLVIYRIIECIVITEERVAVVLVVDRIIVEILAVVVVLAR